MAKHRKKNRAIWIWLGLILLVVGLAAFLLLRGSDKQDVSAPPKVSVSVIPTTTAPMTTTAPTTTVEPAPTTQVPVTTTAPPPSTTTRPPAPAPTTIVPPPPPVDNSYAAQVINITNRYRAQAGCGPVVRNQSLMDQSQYHSYQQAANDRMYHSDGPEGFNTWGENVAYGYDTPEEVMTAWMNSPPHRKNILNCAYTQIGVGYVPTQTNNSPYWTQQFGA